MGKCKVLFALYALLGLQPKEILERANIQLCKGNDSGLFVTCWLGIFTFSTGELKFANAGLSNKILPPKSLQLSLEEYFNYYLNYIKETLKCTKESEEINDLIISVQKVLEEKNENYNFNFYLKIFVECQKIKTIQNHLNLFKIERINIGQLDIENMNEVEEVFNSYIGEPNKININNNPIEEIYQIII